MNWGCPLATIIGLSYFRFRLQPTPVFTARTPTPGSLPPMKNISHRKLVAIALCLVLLACPSDDCDSGVGPSPTTTTIPPTTTTTTTIPEIPVADWFTWDTFHGFSMFAGLRLGESEIRAAFAQSMGSGWETPRVCAETEFWPGTEAYPRIPRNLALLRSFLEVVATIPGAQVLLMGNCTLKHGGLGWEAQRQWNQDVARVAVDFKNVALEVVNEPWHYRHFFYRKWGLVRQLIREAQAVGVREVGADDHVCKDRSLVHELLGVVTFPSFHPCRNIGDNIWDPRRQWLERLIDVNGGLAVLTETVAWDDNGDQCDHFLRTCSKTRIQSYVNRCNATPGCKFTFHSEDGLAARIPYSWFPLARVIL